MCVVQIIAIFLAICIVRLQQLKQKHYNLVLTHTRGKREMEMLFTFHLFDAAQCVLEGVQCRGLAVVSLLSGHVKLQLFQSFNHLLLGLSFGRLLTTASCTITHKEASQILLQEKQFLKNRFTFCLSLNTSNLNHIQC